ncbi:MULTISPECIES: hypothetical protein [unclassified Pseudarthrobacter]|jgi:hypothetical protein|nr:MULTISPECIES: hypothetical protein [unclassified Pseudarthrobacter]
MPLLTRPALLISMLEARVEDLNDQVRAAQSINRTMMKQKD